MNLLRLPFKLTDTVLTHPLTSHKSAYRHRLYKRYFSHVNLTYQKLNKLYLNKLNKLNWPANTFFVMRRPFKKCKSIIKNTSL